MNKLEIKSKLDSITANSQYVRVSESHPLELYLGKNEKGNLTLRFNGTFTPIKVIGSGLLEIKQVKTSSYNSVLFCYSSNDNLSLFYSFCEDIINLTENYKGHDGYTEIINRYNQWKKLFFGNANLLSEPQVQGLIGELLFLRDVSFKKYGITEGLKGWSGPEPTHKDFSYKNEWYEIKSVNSSRSAVTISSIEQLDSEVIGKLVVYIFEKMSESFSGLTLNALVTDMLRDIKFESDQDVFLSKLKQAGYSYNEIYDKYVYSLNSCDFYNVTSLFPRIKRSALPFGVGKVQYEIFLSSIEKFKESK